MYQAAFFGKLVEFRRIAITAEERHLALPDGFPDDLVEILTGIHLVAHMLQAIRDRRIDHGNGKGYLLVCAYGAEFKPVSAPRNGAVRFLSSKLALISATGSETRIFLSSAP